MVTDLFSIPYEATENHQFRLEDSDLQKLLLLLYGCDSTTNTDVYVFSFKWRLLVKW